MSEVSSRKTEELRQESEGYMRFKEDQDDTIPTSEFICSVIYTMPLAPFLFALRPTESLLCQLPNSLRSLLFALRLIDNQPSPFLNKENPCWAGFVILLGGICNSDYPLQFLLCLVFQLCTEQFPILSFGVDN